MSDVSFTLYPGSFYFLTGASGAGKTSLLKLLYLAQRPSRGMISMFGTDIITLPRDRLPGLRRRLGDRRTGGERILAVFEPRSNTMKLGTIKSQLPWSLEQADLAFCHAGGLDWNAADTLLPLGSRAQVASDIPTLVSQVVASAQPGDHIVCMSNGGFGGVHQLLLNALAKKT